MKEHLSRSNNKAHAALGSRPHRHDQGNPFDVRHSSFLSPGLIFNLTCTFLSGFSCTNALMQNNVTRTSRHVSWHSQFTVASHKVNPEIAIASHHQLDDIKKRGNSPFIFFPAGTSCVPFGWLILLLYLYAQIGNELTKKERPFTGMYSSASTTLVILYCLPLSLSAPSSSHCQKAKIISRIIRTSRVHLYLIDVRQ